MGRLKQFFNFLFYVILFNSLCFSKIYSQDFNYLFSLYKQKEYFKLKNITPELMRGEDWQNMYFYSIAGSLSGHYESSNYFITKLIERKDFNIPDSLLAELYKFKILNHINLFEYNDANMSSEILLGKYKSFLDEEELESAQDDADVWRAIKDSPPQKASKSADVKIKLKKDIANLWNIPVNINQKPFDFIFDTGANFSVIVESLAKELGVNIIDAKINVSTATDIKVVSKIAVVEKLEIGGAIFYNTVFLVMPDESLTFGPFYKIRGIIGSPVIKAFEEIRISSDLDFFSPVEIQTSDLRNLTFEELTPVVEIYYLKDSLSFIFDTGAMSTMFYYPYFKKYEKDISGKYDLITLTIGGAGGMKQVKGYELKNINLGSGDRTATLDKVSLLCESTRDKDKYFYGNLGQDYISKFKELTINFKYMYITLK